MHCVAEIAVRFGKIGVGRDRLAMGACCLLVIFQLVERDAEIAQRHRHDGIDLDRAPGFLDRKLGAAGEAQHFAEIGMKQRDIGREPHCLLHMLDRLGELAVLVGDNAAQMVRHRQIGLGLQNLTAHGVGFHQTIFGAKALGLRQRLAERHPVTAFLPCDLIHGWFD